MNGSFQRKMAIYGLVGTLGILGSPKTVLAEDEEYLDEDMELHDRIRPLPMLPGGPMQVGGPRMPGTVKSPVASRPRLSAAGDDDAGAPEGAQATSGDADTSSSSSSSSSSSTTRSSQSSSTDGGDDEVVISPRASSGDRQRPPVLDGNAKVTIDFVDAEVMDIIRYMAEITGRNFILGEKLSGKLTIISHHSVSVAEAYEAFLSALEVAGYTTVTVGQATKVVKTGDASKSPLRVYDGDYVPYTDNFITQIMQFENVSVKDISTVVKEMASASGRVIAYSPTNTLIITDSATNIRRIHKIVNQLDVAAPRSRLEIVALQHATAEDLAEIIKELYAVSESESSTPDPPQTRRSRIAARRRAQQQSEQEADATNVGEGNYISKIIPDERTNSLIIQANEEAMDAIMELVGRLDVDVDPSSRSQIHVVYLEHAKSTEVAQVLSNLATGTVGGTGSRGPQDRGPRVDQRGRPMPGGPGGPDMGAEKSGGAAAAFDSGVNIASDEKTNSLVVIASPEQFRVIKQVIDKLDIRRKQVFVEAVIMEVGSEEVFDLGIGYHMGAVGDDGGYSAYSAQLGGYSLGLDAADLLSGLAMGVFGQSIEVSALQGDEMVSMSVPAFGIALNALQSNSAVNIISTPNVLTTDNEEAKLTVGRNVPFPVSTGRDSNNNPIVSYQREDVAITLKVTPQINESNYVTLEVFQEVQEIEEDSKGLDVSSAGFITSKRSAETTVVAQDNQTVVIGGLIGSTETEVETKIPILGDLPLLGILFRGSRVKSRKTNLLIFLTPHVISEPEDLEEIYRIKVAQRNEYIRRFYGKTKEEQEKELASILRYSMNLVDEPSVYRVKSQSSTNVSTISGSGEEVKKEQVEGEAPAAPEEQGEESAVPPGDEAGARPEPAPADDEGEGL